MRDVIDRMDHSPGFAIWGDVRGQKRWKATLQVHGMGVLAILSLLSFEIRFKYGVEKVMRHSIIDPVLDINI